MSNDVEDDDFDGDDDQDDLEEIELELCKYVSATHARRRLEKLKEDRELKRLISDEFDD